MRIWRLGKIRKDHVEEKPRSMTIGTMHYGPWLKARLLVNKREFKPERTKSPKLVVVVFPECDKHIHTSVVMASMVVSTMMETADDVPKMAKLYLISGVRILTKI